MFQLIFLYPLPKTDSKQGVHRQGFFNQSEIVLSVFHAKSGK
jgi:hypothetical protein